MKSNKSLRLFKKTVNRIALTVFFATILLIPATYGKTLKLLSSWPETMIFVKGILQPFNKNLKEMSKGEMEIRFHGPDVVSAVEQFQPLQSGVFDLLLTMPAYHFGTTAIGAAIDAIKADPTERREKGVFDYIDRHYQKLGVKVVAIIPTADMNFLTRDPIENKNPSFKGLKIRALRTVSPLIKSLGGVPVVLASGDVYTALQKGMLDGAAVITFGIIDLKWHEVTHYLVRPTFGSISGIILMNLNKYNALSRHEQKIITQTGIKSELDAVQFFQEKKSKEVKKLKELGMKVTHFRDEDAQKLNSLFNDSIWAIVKSRSPNETKRLRDFAISKGMTQ